MNQLQLISSNENPRSLTASLPLKSHGGWKTNPFLLGRYFAVKHREGIPRGPIGQSWSTHSPVQVPRGFLNLGHFASGSQRYFILGGSGNQCSKLVQ